MTVVFAPPDNDDANTLVIAETTAGKTQEEIEDIIAGALHQGANVTLTYDDAGNTLTITASGGGGGSEAIEIRTTDLTVAPAVGTPKNYLNTNNNVLNMWTGSAWRSVQSVAQILAPSEASITSLSSLRGWFAARKMGTANGATLATIPNQKASAGADLTKYSSGTISYQTNQINGNSVFNLDGFSQLSGGANLSEYIAQAQCSIFVVAKLNSITNGFGTVGNLLISGRGGNDAFWISVQGDGSVKCALYNGSFQYVTLAAGTVVDGTTYIFSLLHSSAGSLQQCNAVSGTNAVNLTQSLNTGYPLAIGAFENGGAYSGQLNGKIAEIILCNTRISALDTTNVIDFLKTTYGLSY